jgi:hypothetical protein
LSWFIRRDRTGRTVCLTPAAISPCLRGPERHIAQTIVATATKPNARKTGSFTFSQAITPNPTRIAAPHKPTSKATIIPTASMKLAISAVEARSSHATKMMSKMCTPTVYGMGEKM